MPFAIEITIEALEALQRLAENSKTSAGMPISARKWILERIETFVNHFSRSKRLHDQKSSGAAESLGSEYFPRIIELVQKIIGIDPNKMKDESGHLGIVNICHRPMSMIPNDIAKFD